MIAADYCREIEAYLCRKNDGHLIRVVGPSFELVAKWAEQGVPIKVAYAGIDRYFERYYRNGPRRRPVRIDFCEADVLEVFDEWRRATGVAAAASGRESRPSSEGALDTPPNRQSLPAHLARVLTRLSSARAAGSLGEAFDALIDRVSAELDSARARSGGLRGEARAALLDRLRALDAEVLRVAHASLDADAQTAVAREADAELAPFRSTLSDAACARAREAAIDRLVRERAGLPTIAY